MGDRGIDCDNEIKIFDESASIGEITKFVGKILNAVFDRADNVAWRLCPAQACLETVVPGQSEM